MFGAKKNWPKIDRSKKIDGKCFVTFLLSCDDFFVVNYELRKKKVKNWFYKIFYFNIWKFQNIFFIIKSKIFFKIILIYKNMYKKLTLDSKNYKIFFDIEILILTKLSNNLLLLNYKIKNVTNLNLFLYFPFLLHDIP